MISVDEFHDQNAPRAAKLGEVSYEEGKDEKEISDGNKWENITDYSQKGIAKQSGRQLEKTISSWKANIDRHLEKQIIYTESGLPYK